MKRIRYLILIFSLGIFLIGLVFQNIEVLIFSTLCILVHNFIYAFEKFNDRIVFIAFNGTFFTFLIGRFVVKMFTDYTDIYSFNKYGLEFTEKTIIIHIILSLFLSLLLLFIGYYYADKKMFLKLNSLKFENREKYNVVQLAFVSKYFFYISYIFTIIVLIEKAQFTSSFGYTELYAHFSSKLPIIFVKISEINAISLFVYLSTLPKRSKCIIPIGLYAIAGGMSLVVGQRNNFVLNIMIILIYYCFRNTDEETWFGKKEILITISMLPIMLIMLNVVSYSRQNNEINKNISKNMIVEFFYSQGVSVNLIGYAETLKDELSNEKVYTFGRIKTYIDSNIITQVVMNNQVYKAQTLESALYGNSFADSVSYLLSPNRYLNGWGYGSCYIAELYKDFGYFGVIIGNFVLGIILFIIKYLFKKGIFLGGVGLFMIRLLLYVPRDTATSFIVTTFSLINMLGLISIFIAYMILNSKRKVNLEVSG